MKRAYHVKDVDELRECLCFVVRTGPVYCEPRIDEWRRRLSACVDADGGHFEHYLWLLLSKS